MCRRPQRQLVHLLRRRQAFRRLRRRARQRAPPRALIGRSMDDSWGDLLTDTDVDDGTGSEDSSCDDGSSSDRGREDSSCDGGPPDADPCAEADDSADPNSDDEPRGASGDGACGTETEDACADTLAAVDDGPDTSEHPVDPGRAEPGSRCAARSPSTSRPRPPRDLRGRPRYRRRHRCGAGERQRSARRRRPDRPRAPDRGRRAGRASPPRRDAPTSPAARPPR